jgi:predicted NAD/FAD-binding protein
VILALHSDQALAALADPTLPEREILGAIHYRPSEVVLHDDASLLPRRRRAWTSWNVRLDGTDDLGVTYLMNRLQPLPTATPWCVTLNRTAAIDPARIRQRKVFAHPQFDAPAVAAQERWDEISGENDTHYCGAYWRYGFHEDGHWSGQRAAACIDSVTVRAA